LQPVHYASAGGASGTRRGVSQRRLPIRANVPYKGYVWIKVPEKQVYTGAITVALEEDNRRWRGLRAGFELSGRRNLNESAE